jgi:tetratricopeptide (TPR) repeat protein
VIANATVAIPNGYQLLYSNPTLPGMSGGAVLNAKGQLVGTHGQGETDSKMSEQVGVAVKTGTNQAVPIAFYSRYSSGAAVVATYPQATTADDYLSQARALVGQKGSEQEVINLSNQALVKRPSAEAYYYRAYSKYLLKDNQGSFDDYTMALKSNPEMAFAFNNRAFSGRALGRTDDALRDIDRAIELSPLSAELYVNRGYIKQHDMDDPRAAINDYSRALSLSARNANYYLFRASALQSIFDFELACKDYELAKRLRSGNQEALEELKSSLLEIYCREKSASQ